MVRDVAAYMTGYSVVRYTNQFFPGISANTNKRIINVGDHAFQIGIGNDRATVSRTFHIGYLS